MPPIPEMFQVVLAIVAILLAFKLTASILGLAVRLFLVAVLLALAAYWLGLLPDEYVQAVRPMIGG